MTVVVQYSKIASYVYKPDFAAKNNLYFKIILLRSSSTYGTPIHISDRRAEE